MTSGCETWWHQPHAVGRTFLAIQTVKPMDQMEFKDLDTPKDYNSNCKKLFSRYE